MTTDVEIENGFVLTIEVEDTAPIDEPQETGVNTA